MSEIIRYMLTTDTGELYFGTSIGRDETTFHAGIKITDDGGSKRAVVKCEEVSEERMLYLMSNKEDAND